LITIVDLMSAVCLAALAILAITGSLAFCGVLGSSAAPESKCQCGCSCCATSTILPPIIKWPEPQEDECFC
jgi:hypothetical protein